MRTVGGSAEERGCAGSPPRSVPRQVAQEAGQAPEAVGAPWRVPQVRRGWLPSGTRTLPSQQLSNWFPSSARLPFCQSCSQRTPQEQLKGFPTRTLGRGQRLTRAVAPQARGRASPSGVGRGVPSPGCTDPAPSAPGQGDAPRARRRATRALSPSPRPWLSELADHQPQPSARPQPRCCLRVPRRLQPQRRKLRTRLFPHPGHSQLLQGQMLEGFPGKVVQRVGGEVPAGTDPISHPFPMQTQSHITPQPLQGITRQHQGHRCRCCASATVVTP